MATLDITIPTTSTNTPPGGMGKPYTVYTLHVRSSASSLRTPTIQKRYSDFEALHRTLTSSTGSAPPAPLPPKTSSLLSTLSLGAVGGGGGTVGNPTLTEERRQALERYARAIEGAEDARWRESRVWREFLGGLGRHINTDGANNNSYNGEFAGGGFGSIRGGGARVGGQITTAAGWLDAHAQLKTQLHEARSALSRREQAAASAAAQQDSGSRHRQQHEAGSGAKKSLVRAGTLIAQLDDGLRRLGGASGGDGEWSSSDKLGDGEVRRRRDLLAAARKEREGLETLLNTLAVKSVLAGAAEKGDQQQNLDVSATAKRGGLLGAHGAGRTGRVLGGPPAQETERTRELDNTGVAQLQQQMMKEQDMDLDSLAQVVRRMREIGVQMNEELEEQSTMLDLVDGDADRVQGKVDIAKRRIKKIS